MREDFQNIEDGERVKLFPRKDNPLHKRPVEAVYSGGYFYCDGSPAHEGADYYLGDVLTFNQGFEVVAS